MNIRACSAKIPVPLLMFVSLALLLPYLNGSRVAASYNCVSPHCYGLNRWEGGTTGGITDFTIVPVAANVAPGRITNEMWVLQRRTDGTCGNLCWVEAGITYAAGSDASQGQGFERYFHAEQDAAGYHEIPDFPPVLYEDYNANLYEEIIWNPSHSAASIYIYVPNRSITKMVNNQMDPNTMDVGTEISGTDGAGGDPNYYMFNQWLTSDGQGHYQLVPEPYGATGGDTANSQRSDPPIAALWAHLPSAPNSNGGRWLANPPSL